MSSPSQSQSPTQPPPTQQRPDSAVGGNHGQGNSSNLYLVTFLATLFLLLCVSCGIVLRSYILRRRYQRRLEEAIAVGMLLTPRSPGSRRARFGAKPKIFDSWIADGGEKWSEMNPVAAQPVFVVRKYKGGSRTPEAEQPAFHSTNSSNGGPGAYLDMRSFWQRLRTTPTQNNETDDNDQASPVTPTSAQSPSSPAAIHRYRTEMLQVSVLVAMPSRIRSQRKNIPPELKKLDDDDDDEEPLPELALGITKVHRKSLKADGQTLQTTPPSPVELPS